MRDVAAAYLIAGVLAVAGYAALWPQAPYEDGDSAQYLEVARDLSDGRLDALHDRTPGYPLLLALTGSAQQPSRVLFLTGLIFHVACVWLLGAVLHAAGATRPWLLLLAVLLLLPPYVEPAGYVMTENLAQTMLVAGFCLVVLWFVNGRPSLLVAAVLLFAYAAITRPAYQGLGLVLALCLVCAGRIVGGEPIQRRTRRGAAVLAIGTTALLAAYATFNLQRFGYAGVTFSTGFHLSTKTMAFVERLPEEHSAVREVLIRERNAQLTRRGGTHSGTQTIWSVREELQQVTGLSRPELSAHMLKLNLLLIRQAPIEYLEEVTRSAAIYWFPATALAEMGSTPLRWAWTLLHFGLVGGLALQLLVIGGITLFRSFVAPPRDERRLPSILATPVQIAAYLLAGTIVFYTMALSCLIDIGEPRQRRPTDVLIIFMCVLGAVVWHRTRTSGMTGQAPTFRA